MQRDLRTNESDGLPCERKPGTSEADTGSTAEADDVEAAATVPPPFFLRPDKIPEDGPEYEAMLDAMTEALCDWLDGGK